MLDSDYRCLLWIRPIMKRIERRLREYIKEHQEVTAYQMAEYFNKDPKVMKRILATMLKGGSIVSKDKLND